MLVQAVLNRPTLRATSMFVTLRATSMFVTLRATSMFVMLRATSIFLMLRLFWLMTTQAATFHQPKQAQRIPNKYMVLFHPSHHTNAEARARHHAWLKREIEQYHEKAFVEHTYDLGYTGEFDAGLVDKVLRRAEVDVVENDQVVSISGTVAFPNVMSEFYGDRSFARAFANAHGPGADQTKNDPYADAHRPTMKTQWGAPWGLVRLAASKKEPEAHAYTYPSTAGEGVDVYVIDSGVNTAHDEFRGRAVWGTTIPSNTSHADTLGHGTHCAGTIAGKTFGVAKNARIISVKVLRDSGFGNAGDTVKGMAWAMAHHRRQRAHSSTQAPRRALINLSISCAESPSLHAHVHRAIQRGMPVVVAAGNDRRNACERSPAGLKGAMTVAASDRNDQFAFFSNWGECVDIIAPGVDITSAWKGDMNAMAIVSGTSFAAPHVAGAMALHLSRKNYSPVELKELILSESSRQIIHQVPWNTVNRLVSIKNSLWV